MLFGLSPMQCESSKPSAATAPGYRAQSKSAVGLLSNTLHRSLQKGGYMEDILVLSAFCLTADDVFHTVRGKGLRL